MNSEIEKRNVRRARRKMRVSKQVRGTAEKPRLSVHRSNKHILAQLINDEEGKTVASAGTMQKAYRAGEFNKKTKLSAKHIGLHIAKIAKEHNVHKLVFDRGYYKFHGVIAELAEGAREGGMQF